MTHRQPPAPPRSQCSRSQCSRSQCSRSQCSRSQCSRSQRSRSIQCSRPIARLALIAAVLLAALTALAGPPAEAADGRWTVRAAGVWASPSESFTPDPESPEEISVSVDDDLGGALFAEYRLNRRLGLELGWLSTSLDTAVTIESPAIGRNVANDALSVEALTLGLPIYLAPRSPGEGGVELALIPLVASVRYGDLAFDFDRIAFFPRFSFDDELTWGAGLGLELPLGSGRWSLAGSLRWLAAEADGGEGAVVTLDPLLVTVGLGLSF